MHHYFLQASVQGGHPRHHPHRLHHHPHHRLQAPSLSVPMLRLCQQKEMTSAVSFNFNTRRFIQFRTIVADSPGSPSLSKCCFDTFIQIVHKTLYSQDLVNRKLSQTSLALVVRKIFGKNNKNFTLISSNLCCVSGFRLSEKSLALLQSVTYLLRGGGRKMGVEGNTLHFYQIIRENPQILSISPPPPDIKQSI